MTNQDLKYFTFEVDGYRYAERLLEGVLFNVHVTVYPDHSYTVDDVVVQEQYEQWFAQFNQTMYLDMIRQDFLDPATLKEEVGELGAIQEDPEIEALADMITEPKLITT